MPTGGELDGWEMLFLFLEIARTRLSTRNVLREEGEKFRERFPNGGGDGGDVLGWRVMDEGAGVRPT